MIYRAINLLFIALAPLVATSCAITTPAKAHNVTGPPAYAAGFNDGCPSGRSAAGDIYAPRRKNVERAIRDERYRMGWEDGFRQCKGETESVHRMLGPVF